MTKNDNPNRQPVIVAAVVAGFLMLVSSAAYRVLAARLAAPVNTTLLSPAALERLPLQIGNWAGQNVPLDEAIVRATDTGTFYATGDSTVRGLANDMLNSITTGVVFTNYLGLSNSTKSGSMGLYQDYELRLLFRQPSCLVCSVWV